MHDLSGVRRPLRLQAVNAISYIREAAAIHIAVASDASEKLALLAKVS